MVLKFRKKWLWALVAAVVFACGVLVWFAAIAPTFQPAAAFCVVIDAGHGGVDGGAEGVSTGVSESFLNLQYAQTLKKICEGFGWDVTMTRSDMNGLYSAFASNKKRSEMAKRKQIIQNSGADMVISVHMNSFSSSEARGAQVYYYVDADEAGQALAESVQSSLHSGVEYAKTTAKAGDFYVLGCTQAPSILVECGFLSNAEEEVLLQDEEYMQNFCYHLFCGMLQFFVMNEG